MLSVSGLDDRCYWQIVPGAAKIWRVIGVLRVTPSIDHANVAALPLVNVFREDVVEPSLPHEKAISTAPEAEQGRFKVPRIMEEPS